MRTNYKKLLFILLLLFQSSIGFCWTRIDGNTELGQEAIPYDSILSEGRSWCTKYTDPYSSDTKTISIRIISVDGNVIFNGITYKRLKEVDTYFYDESIQQFTRYLSPMREDGGRTYKLDTLTQKEYLDFDSNLRVGDAFEVYVEDIDELYKISIKDITVLPFGPDNTERTCYILDDGTKFVEGIGYCVQSGTPFYEEIITGSSPVFVCCHNADGTCIYGSREHDCPLNDPLVVGINNFEQDSVKEKNSNSKYFNLYGQRINGLQKGLNIVDGKKIMVK